MQLADRLDAFEAYLGTAMNVILTRMKAEGKDVINLGLGDPDVVPTVAMRKNLADACYDENNHHYPSFYSPMPLKEAIAGFYERQYGVKSDPETEVLPLLGSADGLFHIHTCLLDPGDTALVPDPCYPAYVAGALEVPPVRYLPAPILDWCVLRPMRWATAGSILGMRAALDCGLAVNLGGGFHHARPSEGEGFCIYSDIGLAVDAARRESLIDENARIAYVDLDAHQGNGVSHVFREDRRVFMFDMYNCRIYPWYDVSARQRVDCDLPITSTTTEGEYLGLLCERLPGFLDSIGSRYPVRLGIYNAGTDVFDGDPLGDLAVSAEGVLERDLFVVRELRKREIPTLMLLSGGYTRTSYDLVTSSIVALVKEHGI
jgi:histone deacetylase 11